MQQVPARPAFTKVVTANLKSVDWADKTKGRTAVEAIQAPVAANSKARQSYMEQALQAAKDRAKEMQTSASFGSKGHKDTSLVNTDAALKTARDEVKQLMVDSAAVEKDYFAAMGDFRNVNSFDFAGAFAPFFTQMRTNTQDADKVAGVIPAQIKALEGFASGLIKQIRDARGAMANDAQRLTKIQAAGAKVDTLAKDIALNLTKMESTLRSLDGMLPQAATKAKDMKTLASDFDGRYTKFFTGMGAIVTLRQAMEALAGSITGHGFGDMVKKANKAAEQQWTELVKQRDKVEKMLAALLKDKALPADIKKQLPKTLTAK